MTTKKIYLASDNWSGAHPLIVDALIEANAGYAAAYGGDPWTSHAEKLIQEAFKKDCQVFILPTGTGANNLSLMLACRRHESVICSDVAHIHHQESGAPEALIGCKLLTVPHRDGKITPEAILKRLRYERAFGKHGTSPRVLAITQATEFGTVYTLRELQALSHLCKEENLLLHVDGSRLFNACAHLNVDLHEMFADVAVDLLALGGTKNGLLFAESLLVFNSQLREGNEYLQKQSLQLISKMRYVSAQYIPFFKIRLWRDLANHANQKALEIESVISSTKKLSLNYPVETNQIFFSASPDVIEKLQSNVVCHVWDHELNQVRFVTSWNTSDDDVSELQTIVDGL